jgi:hypothetical protein
MTILRCPGGRTDLYIILLTKDASNSSYQSTISGREEQILLLSDD